MAAFKRVTPPAEEPVSVEELRAYLRLSHDADDALIARLARAARERVEEETGRALAEQTWRMAADVEEGAVKGAFRVFALRRPPYLSFIEARIAKDDGTSIITASRSGAAEVEVRLSPTSPSTRALAASIRVWISPSSASCSTRRNNFASVRLTGALIQISLCSFSFSPCGRRWPPKADG